MLKYARISPKYGIALVITITIAAFILGLPMSGTSVFFIFCAFYITFHLTLADVIYSDVDDLDKADIASLNHLKSISELRQWESERPKVTKYIPYIDSHYNHESWCECNRCRTEMDREYSNIVVKRKKSRPKLEVGWRSRHI